MIFFLVLVLSLYVGRQLGWALSGFLYKCPRTLCGILCVGWALVIALGLRMLIDALHPGLVLKVIGFGEGAYLASVNYGLVAEWSIPKPELPRHRFISIFPVLEFI